MIVCYSYVSVCYLYVIVCYSYYPCVVLVTISDFVFPPPRHFLYIYTLHNSNLICQSQNIQMSSRTLSLLVNALSLPYHSVLSLHFSLFFFSVHLCYVVIIFF